MEGQRFKQEPGLLTLLCCPLMFPSNSNPTSTVNPISLSLSHSHTHTTLLLKTDTPKYLLVHAVSWWKWLKVSFNQGKEAQELTVALDHCVWLAHKRVWAYRCVPIVTETRAWDFLVTPRFDFSPYSLRKTYIAFFGGSSNTYYIHIC